MKKEAILKMLMVGAIVVLVVVWIGAATNITRNYLKPVNEAKSISCDKKN